MADHHTTDAGLAQLVLGVVRTYVNGRTAARTNMDRSTFPSELDDQGRPRRRYSKEWFEARADVARQAFLQMRSNKSREDFVEYLTGTLCAHGLESGDAGYADLAARLVGQEAERANRWEDVRSLAMLAVSTMAYVRASNDDAEEGDDRG
jgi:CRISPR-associated protein Cmx8